MNTGKLSFSNAPIQGERLPVEDIQQMNKVLDEKYKINEAHLDSVENTLNTIKVDERNNDILAERKDATLTAIRDLRNSGNLENAARNVKGIVSNLANDELFQAAIYDKQLVDKANAELDSAYKKYLEGGKDKTGIDAKMYADARRNNRFNNTKALTKDKDGVVVNYFTPDVVPNKQEIEEEIFEKFKGLKESDAEFAQLDKSVNFSNNPALISEWNRAKNAAASAGYFDLSQISGVSKETLSKLAIGIFKTEKIQNYVNWKAKSHIIETLGMFDETGKPIVDENGNSQFKQIDVSHATNLINSLEKDIQSGNTSPYLATSMGIGKIVEKIKKVKGKDGKEYDQKYEEYDLDYFLTNNLANPNKPNGIDQEQYRELYHKMYKLNFIENAIDYSGTFSYANMKQNALYNQIAAESRKLRALKEVFEVKVEDPPTFQGKDQLMLDPTKNSIVTPAENERNININNDVIMPGALSPTYIPTQKGFKPYIKPAKVDEKVEIFNYDNLSRKTVNGQPLYKAAIYDPNTLSYYLYNRDSKSREIFNKKQRNQSLNEDEQKIYNGYRDQWVADTRSKAVVNPTLISFPNRKEVTERYGIKVAPGSKEGENLYTYPAIEFTGVTPDANGRIDFSKGDTDIKLSYDSPKQFHEENNGEIYGVSWTSGAVSVSPKSGFRDYITYGTAGKGGTYVVNSLNVRPEVQNGIRVSSMAARPGSKIDQIDANATLDANGYVTNEILTKDIVVDANGNAWNSKISTTNPVSVGIDLAMSVVEDGKQKAIETKSFYLNGGNDIVVYHKVINPKTNTYSYELYPRTFTPGEIETNVRRLYPTGNTYLNKGYTDSGSSNTLMETKQMYGRAVSDYFDNNDNGNNNSTNSIP